jgi:16S rRNA processing protein RimM
MKDVLRIGLIVRPQGIRGEVKILPLTDDANRFSDLTSVLIESDGAYTDAKITVNRVSPDAVYAYIQGHYTREAAEGLRDCYLCVHRKDAVALPAHSYFIADLVGLNVRSAEDDMGELVEVIQTGGVDVYRVRRPDGTHFLFPALRRVMTRVDIENGVMHLDPAALMEVSVDED